MLIFVDEIGVKGLQLKVRSSRPTYSGKSGALSFRLVWILPFAFPLSLSVPSTHAGPWTPSLRLCSPCLQRGSTVAWSGPPRRPRKALKDTSAVSPGWSCKNLGVHWQTNLVFSSDTQNTHWQHRRRFSNDLIGLGACYKLSKVKHCSGLHAGVSHLRKGRVW